MLEKSQYRKSSIKNWLILVPFAFIGWALCFATIGIGMRVTSQNNALIIHAIAAPIFFAILSIIYFKRFSYTSPIQTAAFFTVFVITLDFFVVALLIIKSFEMFTSLLGTWIPFALIFLSTYITGLFTMQREIT